MIYKKNLMKVVWQFVSLNINDQWNISSYQICPYLPGFAKAHNSLIKYTKKEDNFCGW
jgi:hypothetical protein